VRRTFPTCCKAATAANRLHRRPGGHDHRQQRHRHLIFGGAGDDVLIGGQNALWTTAPPTRSKAARATTILVGGQGNDILRGGDGDDTLVGGIAAGTTIVSQVFTNDGGDDTYDGGDGTDDAIAYGTIPASARARSASPSTSAISPATARSPGTAPRRLVDQHRAGHLPRLRRQRHVKGGGSLDSLQGNSRRRRPRRLVGNDILSGGLGNDTLIGGEGLDTATYVNSTAGVTVDLRIAGVAQNTGGDGIDTLVGIEYLTGSNFGDTLSGNDDFNLITDNHGLWPAGQTDSLFGYGGNDSILVTRAAAAVATNINMDGGDGDDFIELRGGTLSAGLAVNLDGLIAASNGASQTYMALGTTSTNRNVDVVTVDGGAGNDRIILSGVASATVNAGSGADLVSISMLGAAGVNNYQLTLGSGADIVQLGVGSNAAASTAAAVTARTSRVTDFERGDAGDKFEMSTFLNNSLTGYTANSNAFASGHLRLTQSGSDLLVQVDRDAGGATNAS
jgi:Ca2+-binding RTX toxin-like protein